MLENPAAVIIQQALSWIVMETTPTLFFSEANTQLLLVAISFSADTLL